MNSCVANSIHLINEQTKKKTQVKHMNVDHVFMYQTLECYELTKIVCDKDTASE